MSSGKPTIIVTRPLAQAAPLAAELNAQGLPTMVFPLLEIGPTQDPAPLDAELAALERYALVVFVSPNAIEHAFARLNRPWPGGVAIGVVGPGSVQALAQRGLQAPAVRIISPPSGGVRAARPGEAGAGSDAQGGPDGPRYDSEALIAALAAEGFDAEGLGGRQVLLVRGNGGRELLSERLVAAGAEVTVVEAYQRNCPQPLPAQWSAVRALLGQNHAWLLTSSGAVHNLLELARTHLNADEMKRLREAWCFAPHARIAETARDRGFDRVVLTGAGDRGLIDAVLDWVERQAAESNAATPAAAQLASQVTAQSSAQLAPAADVAAPAGDMPAAGAVSARDGARADGAADDGVGAAGSKGGASAGDAPGVATEPAPGGTHFSQSAPAGSTQALAPAGNVMMPPVPALSSFFPPWSRWFALLTLVVVIAGAWMVRRIDGLTHELARRQQNNDLTVQEARVLARTAQEQAKELQARIGAHDARLTEARERQMVLEQLYQDISRNREDWLVAEIEQILTTTVQQLQLTGNVQVALTALQNADARLARAERPQFNGLRRALAKDIERLKALPAVDLAGASIRLDEAVIQVDTLPMLAAELSPVRAGDRHGARKSGAGMPEPGLLERFWDSLSSELLALVSIRRVDEPRALLASPEQSWFVRENLKLRLLNARLALLSRNEAVFRADLDAAQQTLARYFDTKARRTLAVQSLLRQVQANAVSIDLPMPADSLAAVRALKGGS